MKNNELDTHEAKVDGSLGGQGQPGLLSEFQDSQSYMVRPCLKRKQQNLFEQSY